MCSEVVKWIGTSEGSGCGSWPEELDEGNEAQEHEVKPQCENNTPYAGR